MIGDRHGSCIAVVENVLHFYRYCSLAVPKEINVMPITVVPIKRIGRPLRVCFTYDESSIAKELLIDRILRRFGGASVGSGVALTGPYAGIREVECEVPHEKYEAAAAAVRAAGFDVEEDEDIIVEELDGMITIRPRRPGERDCMGCVIDRCRFGLGSVKPASPVASTTV
jgi:hypothetical protein